MSETTAKTKEDRAAEKAYREGLATQIYQAVMDNLTRADPLDMFPKANKYSQLNMLSSVEAISKMRKRVARLESLRNSIGSGFSINHVLWVCDGLDSVQCWYAEAAVKINPESLRMHRSLYGGALLEGTEEQAEKFAAWALSSEPATLELIHDAAISYQAFSRSMVEPLITEQDFGSSF